MTLVMDVVPGLLFDEAAATFSVDRVYRYRLTRTWDPSKPRCLFVMLNPSTADAFKLDPTVNRCMGFARREGCGALEVVNLFALRSTDPEALYGHDDPVGPGNEDALCWAVSVADLVVAAWGFHANALAETVANQPAMVDEIMAEAGKPLWCLGRTKDGSPRHPLYVKGTRPLEAFDG